MPGNASAPISDADRTRPITANDIAYIIYTSGTTGQPKGVLVPQRGLRDYFVGQVEIIGLADSDAAANARILYFSSPSFDATIFDFAMVFGSGATMIVSPPAIYGGDELAALIRDEDITHAGFRPAVLASIAPDQVPSLRVVLVGGDAVSRELVGRWSGVRPLINCYGPTETTVVAVDDVLDPQQRNVTIGTPVRGSYVVVLDTRLRPVPVGVSGELYIGGSGVAAGYNNRVALTSERFIADPFGPPGARLYRTGDLVRWNLDGRLEYQGRNDFQLKIRGFRIELGEIDSVIGAHEDVEFVATYGYTDPSSGVESLIAYVCPRAGASPEPTALAQFAARSLPRYMVPAAITIIDSVPLTSSAKVDRAALPAPQFLATAHEYRAPVTPFEHLVAEVYTEVLGTERAGLDDGFFDLGGNSLVATKVVSRLNSAIGADIGVRTLFEAPTVAALAERLEAASSAPSRAALRPFERRDPIPLSLAQQRIWFLSRLEPESPAYNLPFAVRMRGAVDVDALQQALVDVIERHEALRTVFPDSVDGPRQQILRAHEASPELTPTVIDSSETADLLAGLAARGFDVTCEPPLRAQLWQIAGGGDSENDDVSEYVLGMVVHHIAADGWSLGPLGRDVMVAYSARARGEELSWEPLPVQYADYALWQREVLGEETDAASLAATQVEFWTRTLDGAPPELPLPLDRPRPATQSHRGGTVDFVIPASTHAALDSLARANQASLFMVLHSAFAVLLRRFGAGDDIVVGTPVAGRGEKGLDELIGMFVNTLVLRTQVRGDASFIEVLDDVRTADLRALGHTEIPFERLVEAIDPPRAAGRHPLFQVMLSVENLGHNEFTLPGLDVSLEEIDAGVAKFDLQLTISDPTVALTSPAAESDTDGVRATMAYAQDLFDRTTVQQLVDGFLRVLTSITENPELPVGDISVLALDDAAALTPVRGPIWDGEPEVLGDIFAAAAAEHSDSPAVRYLGETMTYGELFERARRLSAVLVAHGAGPDTFVALAIARSADSVIAMWATALSGAAFMPVDPNYPAERIRTMIADSGAVVGVTTSDLRPSLPDTIDWLDLGDANAPVAPTPVTPTRPSVTCDHAAYLIYTSGSTGVPKGVVVTHRGLAEFADEQRERYGVSASSRPLHLSSPSFDAAVLDLLLAARSGAELVVAPAAVYADEPLRELMIREKVTHTFVTPSVLGTMDPAGLDDLEAISVGGEMVTPTTVQRWSPGRRLFNGYGPTETTIMSNISDPLEPGQRITVGGPIRGMSAMVLDDRLRPAPVGVAGELYLAGPGLARGYHRRHSLTSERFVAHPYGTPGERMYRTGDIVRWTPERTVEYVGRADSQIKLRGQRIELGEIESALLSHPEVSAAIVRVHAAVHDGQTHESLVGYVVPTQIPSDPAHPQLDTASVLAHVASSMPRHMVPSSLIPLERIPLTVNGKLDARALPEPEPVGDREFVAPRTDTERTVAAVFAAVLDDVDREIGASDEFFDLGGNSLIATRVIARINEACGVDLRVRELFDASSVSALAQRIDTLSGGDTQARGPVLEAGPRPEHIPLAPAQQRIWFANQYDTSSAAYNIAFGIRLTGDLDVEALQRSVLDVLDRHESLRTTYPSHEGMPTQVVLPTAAVMNGLDVTEVSSSAELTERLSSFAKAGFDVAAEVPIRAVLYRVGGEDTQPRGELAEYVIAMAVHHIAGDGASMGVLARDLMTAYSSRVAGTAPVWDELVVQYADYALWQRERMETVVDAPEGDGSDPDDSDPDTELGRQLEYWTRQLADAPEKIELPTDYARPSQQSMRGGSVPFTIDAQTHAELARLAASSDATLFMAVHAALSALLARLAATDDVVIGTPIAGRGAAALDDLVGMFVGTLALRAKVDPQMPFRELLRGVRDTDLDAFAHADVSFEHIVEALDVPRSTAHSPIFQVMLSFQNFAPVRLELPSLQVEQVDIDLDTAQFDLTFTLAQHHDDDGRPAGLDGKIEYASDLFTAAGARTLGQRFARFVAAVVADPEAAIGDIELLTDSERREQHDQTTWVDYLPATAPQLIESQIARTPDAPALVFEDQQLTYAEFGHRINQFARHLISVGVGPESPVAIAMERSFEMVIAMHAVQAAGGAYLPIEPTDPQDRRDYVLETARPTCVLTSVDHVGLFAHLPCPVVALDDIEFQGTLSEYSTSPIADADRLGSLHPSNTAYMIFTSGSTGRPKGVQIPHRGLVNQMYWMSQAHDMGPHDAVIHKTPFTFDVAVWELFVPLCVGARIVIARPGGHRDLAYLTELSHHHS
ncbi:MAG: amino acid adenylation domain-containing protein, partial [Rhodococcus sp.]|nr:amino acid adenylation domain-containing protein [Rhodococcus sp. (in: high G+C Gram-positive bacteria)]